MSRIVQTFSLEGGPWPGMDPFLFTAHHRDVYPAADGDTMRPATGVEGRDLGMDFSGQDGWSMYHGRRVPGFPQHPHQGFETITIVEEGLVDHTDSEGAVARYGGGDTQWLTAGRGVAHAEMFPLIHDDAPNPLHLFQIWINLAPEDKSAEPHFAMFWAEDTPVVVETDPAGRTSRVKVVAGDYRSTRPLTPPPHSWAARTDAGVAVWHVTMEPGAELTLPPASVPEAVRTLYVYDGEVTANDTTLRTEGAVVTADSTLDLTAGAGGARFLVLQGRPIGAPVVQRGPFVTNTREQVVVAYADYRAGRFGRWTLPVDDPVQPLDTGRFARYPDGTVLTPR
ncbi:pirin family protein [Raineyella fluvialis]|uniref:Pirin family protein n=1 Tax=Raineyella fluvialis TaxID=2662261 RepID=A0A5Q2FJ51_9ACTN|nr:pirin family protein [Raineyella fluvialis]QGF24685.1 pirin family protein [Raineyella fluvialis]